MVRLGLGTDKLYQQVKVGVSTYTAESVTRLLDGSHTQARARLGNCVVSTTDTTW